MKKKDEIDGLVDDAFDKKMVKVPAKIYLWAFILALTLTFGITALIDFGFESSSNENLEAFLTLLVFFFIFSISPLRNWKLFKRQLKQIL